MLSRHFRSRIGTAARTPGLREHDWVSVDNIHVKIVTAMLCVMFANELLWRTSHDANRSRT